MKKKYMSPELDVIEFEAGSLLQEASLELKEGYADSNGLSRDIDLFFDDED